MRALFLYGAHAGRGSILGKIPALIRELKPLYDYFAERYCASEEEMSRTAFELGGNFDVLLFAGGDGTFNVILNAVVRLKKRPILGYLPAGTLNDVGKCLGIRKSLRAAVRVLRFGYVRHVDVVKTNDRYFAYMCALGQFSDIAYRVKRREKKRIGKNAYYRLAFKEAFKKRMVKARATVDGKSVAIEAPFLMILNGRYVAGFKVNKESSMEDGKAELFYSRPGIFNGLARYFFHRGVTKISARKFIIETDEPTPWCFDGEAGRSGPLTVECLPSFLSVFAPPARRRKTEKPSNQPSKYAKP